MQCLVLEPWQLSPTHLFLFNRFERKGKKKDATEHLHLSTTFRAEPMAAAGDAIHLVLAAEHLNEALSRLYSECEMAWSRRKQTLDVGPRINDQRRYMDASSKPPGAPASHTCTSTAPPLHPGWFLSSNQLASLAQVLRRS